MLTGDNLARFVRGVQNGLYHLLLGAGFSYSAVNGAGEQPPLGDALRDIVASTRKLPPKYSLAQLAQTIPQAELQTLLARYYKGCVPSKAAKILSQYRWQHVFTYNVDDVLDAVYRVEPRVQNGIPITTRMPYRKSSEHEVPIVYLHGSVLHPSDFVFSTSQYAESSAKESTWFKVLADVLPAEPFIIIGCGPAEVDFEYYLKRRSSSSYRADTVPSIFVNPSDDEVIRHQCATHNLIHIKCTSDEFLEWLSAVCGPQRDDAYSPALVALSPSTEAAIVRTFFRQWLPVKRDEMPVPLETRSLLEGIEPNWKHVVGNEWIPRTRQKDLVGSIVAASAEASPGRRLKYLLVSGSAEGKSSSLKIVSMQLSDLGIPVFFYTNPERLKYDIAQAYFSNIRQYFVVVVDDLNEHANQVANLVAGLDASHANYAVLGAARQVYMTRLLEAFPPKTFMVGYFTPMNEAESSTLVDKLREAGSLGLSAGRTNGDLVSDARGKSLVAAIASLNPNHPLLDRAVRGDLSGLSEQGLLAYAVVALAHSRNRGVHIATVGRAAGLASGVIGRLLEQELRLLVQVGGIGDARLRTRHRVIAERTVGMLESEMRRHVFTGLVYSLSHFVSRESQKRGTEEARLAADLLDYDKSVKKVFGADSSDYYDSIRASWQWNSRFWEQRALLEVDLGDLDVALQYAETAVGIEQHPVTYTTLAKVRFRRARRSHYRSEYDLGKAMDAIDRARALNTTHRYRDPYPLFLAVTELNHAVKAGRTLLQSERAWADEVVDSAQSYGVFSELGANAPELLEHLGIPAQARRKVSGKGKRRR